MRRRGQVQEATRPGREGLGPQSRERDALTEKEKIAVVTKLRQPLTAVGFPSAEFLRSGALGSRDSAHDVFFASTADSAGVAFKRFRRNESAGHEVSAMAEARRRGFRTFNSLGIYDIDNLGHVMVTERIPRFKTMNQLGWQNFYAGDPEYVPLAQRLRSISKHVGRMHQRGITHGDLQLKNIGVDGAGQYVLFDLEDARFHDAGDDDFAFGGQCVDDLKTLVGSLVSHGYLGDATSKIFEAEIVANVIEPYLHVNQSETILDDMDKILAHGLFLREQHATMVPAGAAAGRLATMNTMAA